MQVTTSFPPEVIRTPTIVNLTWGDIEKRALDIAGEIDKMMKSREGKIRVFGVSRGGILAALAVQSAHESISTEVWKFRLVEDPTQADVIVDDIIDSGKTMERFQHYEKPFYALVNKQEESEKHWYVFPWERMTDESGPEDSITRLIQFIGDNPTREGLRDTPKRVIKSYKELFGGYKMDIAEVIKTFEDPQSVCDEMVISKDIEFYSTCEHHMLPFFGKAHIAYIPGKTIIGLSKLSRILEVFARRLQVQEHLTKQVTDAIDNAIDPQGSACIIEASHFCCMARGVGKQSSKMVTSSLTGVFRKQEVRMELLSLIN